MVPAPLYFHPLEPAGEPSPFQPPAGSAYTSLSALPVSKIDSVAPSTFGALPVSGRSNAPVAREMNFATTPYRMRTVPPGISSSGSSAAWVGLTASIKVSAMIAATCRMPVISHPPPEFRVPVEYGRGAERPLPP